MANNADEYSGVLILVISKKSLRNVFFSNHPSSHCLIGVLKNDVNCYSYSCFVWMEFLTDLGKKNRQLPWYTNSAGRPEIEMVVPFSRNIGYAGIIRRTTVLVLQI